MPSFHHSRLIVYRRSIDFVALAAEINSDIQPPCAFLRDQLGRAATSIALNVAEGSGEFSRGEKARFYRIARRSATECAAILEALEAFGFNRPDMLATGRKLLHEIIAMLTVMAKPADLKSRVKSPRKGPGEETGA